MSRKNDSPQKATLRSMMKNSVIPSTITKTGKSLTAVTVTQSIIVIRNAGERRKKILETLETNLETIGILQ